MKCAHCEDSRIFFTIMPDIAKDIGWSSHVLVERKGRIGLYHYQCGRVDVMGVYQDLLEMIGESVK